MLNITFTKKLITNCKAIEKEMLAEFLNKLNWKKEQTWMLITVFDDAGTCYSIDIIHTLLI